MYENLPLLLISLFIGIISIAAVVLFRISVSISSIYKLTQSNGNYGENKFIFYE